MTNAFRDLLLIALPYVALAVFVTGLVWRYRSQHGISARSSQILERGSLPFGSVPFHFGIAIIVVGHLLPLVAPDAWQAFVSRRSALLAVEAVGAGAAILCAFGLAVLLLRRIASAKVRSATTVGDVAVLVVLLVQVALGFGVAAMYRWGAVWSVRTTTPYLWSIFTLRPDPSFIAGAPPVIVWHIALAWVTLAIIPFTRLVHMFALPLGYLARRPQKVVWNAKRT